MDFFKWFEINKDVLKSEYDSEPSEVKEKESFEVWVKIMFKEWTS